MAGDYVTLYQESRLSEQDPAAILSLAFLFMARMFPIIAQAPFFGAKVLPHPVKVTLGLSLFLIFMPQLILSVSKPLVFNLDLMILMAKELLIGTLLGFLFSLPFNIVQSAGVLIDNQRGGASLMVNDPIIQNQSSPLGTLFNYLLIYLFYMINGPFQVIDIVAKSYDVLPPDKLLSPVFFYEQSRFWTDMMKVLGKVMIVSTQLAMPALLMILMTDIFLGIANRLAPQVQISFLGMPLKSLLALVIVFFGFQLFNTQMIRETNAWITYVSNLVLLFKPSTS